MKIFHTKTPAYRPSISNTYELEISFMFGNENHIQTTVTRIAEEHKKKLLKLLQVIERCMEYTEQDEPIEKKYDHLEGYRNYFGTGTHSLQEFLNLRTIFQNINPNYCFSPLYHPCDPSNNVPGLFHTCTLFHYDQEGRKFIVVHGKKDKNSHDKIDEIIAL